MTVEDYRRTLDGETLETVDALRRIVAGAHPDLVEGIKWNAPSFSLAGEDRITLGLERKGGVRLVLHRGAKAQESGDFRFEDPHGLARWPAPDRGVMVFADRAQVDRKAEAVRDLCARWLAATA